MTFRELVEQMNKTPEAWDWPIVTSGYEGGVTELAVVELVDVIKNVHPDEWYYGEHEVAGRYEGSAVKMVRFIGERH
jgi:hypothetical protein